MVDLRSHTTFTRNRQQLVDRFLEGPARGLVRAKTGSLPGVTSLAGTLLTTQGRLLAFAVIAEATGATTSRFPANAPRPDSDRSHVAMQVALDACISCNLCVRACREVQVNDVIGLAYRGHRAAIVFDQGAPMGASTCVGCGECVQACPTGALLPAAVLDERGVRAVLRVLHADSE